MTKKIINPKLLWQVMFWVLYKYAQLTPSQKSERQLRGFQAGDGKKAKIAIQTIRMSWHYQQKAWNGNKRPRPQFVVAKSLVLNSLTMEHQWDESTRNYVSSCATTYISWDSRGQSDVSLRKLRLIERYAQMFFDPNNIMEEIK